MLKRSDTNILTNKVYLVIFLAKNKVYLVWVNSYCTGNRYSNNGSIYVMSIIHSKYWHKNIATFPSSVIHGLCNILCLKKIVETCELNLCMFHSFAWLQVCPGNLAETFLDVLSSHKTQNFVA